MRELNDALFSIFEDFDMHETEFRLVHFKDNEHVDLAFRRDRHGNRTLHLGPVGAYNLGTRLLRFARTRQLLDPQGLDDYQI